MGRRAAGKAKVLGWIAVLALPLALLFAASPDRFMQGVSKALAPVASPSDIAQEKERQAVRDEVARETTAESVRNLFTHEVSHRFSSHWQSLLILSRVPDARMLNEGLKGDPRVAKLLDIIQHGSETDVSVLHKELRKAIDVFLHELPLRQPMGEQAIPTVEDPWSAVALPLLLAAFPPSFEHLQLLVAMADAIERADHEALGENWPELVDSAQTLSVRTSLVLAYNVDQVLSHLADKWTSGETLPPQRRAILDSYLQFREEQRALALAMIENEAARETMKPEALDGLRADPYLLDSYSWCLPWDLGRSGQPMELHTGHRRERKVLAFAKAVCAAANPPPGGEAQ